MKKAVSFPIENFTEIRNKMLNWAQPFNIFCLLDNSKYNFETPAFECMLAAGSQKNLVVNAGEAFNSLKHFFAGEKDWLFGHLGYDLKNETEQLNSIHFDGIGFPDCHFFVPEIVLQLNEKGLTIYSEQDAADIFSAIELQDAVIEQKPAPKLALSNRISPTDYVAIVKKLQQHILRGDCYEINFCQEFFASGSLMDPLSVYNALTTISPNPFSALYKLNHRYCVCASPKDILKKEGAKYIHSR